MQKAKKHILFWLLYVGFTVAIYNVKEPSLGLHLTYELASLPAKMFMVYFILYFTLPHYLLKKKYAGAVVQFTLALAFSVWLLHVSVSQVLYPVYYPEAEIFLVPKSMAKLVAPLLDLVIVSSLAVVVKLLEDREQQERNQLHLEKLNVQNELQLLRSQLHPHFLFNTLNGLYAQIVERPAVACQMVLNLSDLLRFMVYEGNKSLVMVADDLKCVSNYLALEKIRYGKKLKIEFTVRGDPDQKQMVPLLILPFMENAFKHGPSKELLNSWISCEINLNHRSMSMELKNSKGSYIDSHQNHQGVGLINVQQRLEHTYKNQYQLKIENQNEQFSVFLKIPIVPS